MRNILKKILPVFFAAVVVSVFFSYANTEPKEPGSMGNGDLKVYYGAKTSLGIFSTPYKGFTRSAGNSGRWEDTDKYLYTWGEGQAAFIKTGEMKNPQLVLIVLSDKFRTPRGIKKGSTADELLRAYPDNYETVEGGNGLWYVYKWTAKSKSPLIDGKEFSLSVFVEDNIVKSVMLKLEGDDTSEIPVGYSNGQSAICHDNCRVDFK